MFLSRYKNKNVHISKTQFYYTKVGSKGVKRHDFVMPLKKWIFYATDLSKALVWVLVFLCVAVRLFAAGLFSYFVLFVVLLLCYVDPV